MNREGWKQLGASDDLADAFAESDRLVTRLSEMVMTLMSKRLDAEMLGLSKDGSRDCSICGNLQPCAQHLSLDAYRNWGKTP